MLTSKKLFIATALCLVSLTALAEGRCPPGQYPIGDQNVGGCAPIPGAGAPSQNSAPVPTGKWESRWGAIAEDSSANSRGVTLATGVAESQKSKRDATKIALGQCKSGGGLKCEVVATYHDQCIAVADPSSSEANGQGRSVIYRAENSELAKREALKRCTAGGNAECSIIYAACSMSEFKKF